VNSWGLFLILTSIRHHIICVCWGIFLTGQAFAYQQPDLIQFVQVLSQPGTKLNPVLQIEQDNQGLMWLGTQYRGLQTFDGYQSQHYRWDPQRSNGLRGEEIKSLFKDKEGTIWVSTHKRGIYRYDPTQDFFQELEIVGSDERVNSVSDISQTNDGTLWAAVHGLGLYKISQEDGKLTAFDTSFPTISKLHPLSNGHVVGGYKNGLFLIESAKSLATVQIELQGIAPSALHSDAEGDIWIGTKLGLLIEYDLEARRIKQKIESPDLKNARINQIHLDQFGNLWVLTTQGIILIKANGEFQKLESDPQTPGTLNSSICRSIFEDKNGLIWIGTDTGLNVYDPFRNKFKLERLGWTEESPASKYISTTYTDVDGSLWVGTQDGFIHKKPSGQKEYQHIEILPDAPTGYTTPFMAIAFSRESANTLLVGTTHGLFRYYESSGTFERIVILSDNRDQKVRAILPINDELILYATSWGLVVHQRIDDTFEVFLPQPEQPGLSNSVTRLLLDVGGNLWVGTYGGLAVFDIAERKFLSPFSTSDNFPELFESHGILGITEYRNHLWVGTLNHGFFQIKLKDFFEDGRLDHSIRRWLFQDGLPDDVVYNITPDGFNNLWLTTNNGISKFQLADSSFENYNMRDGLVNDEFNMYAHTKGIDGKIYLGGVSGLNAFMPNEMGTPNPFPPSVFFGELTILNNTRDQSIGHELESFALHQHNGLELHYDQNFLRFTFYSDHYSSPGETSYEYKLSKVDEGWVQATNGPIATYTNLDPGNYELQVRAANYDGIWGTPSSFTFTLSAPFWRDTWFYVFAFAFISLLVVLLIYIRTKNNRRKQRELQAIILERTRDIHLQKDLIDAQNEELKVSQENLTRLNNSKDFIFSILSHDLRSPLTTLKGFLGLLVESVDIFSKEEIVRLSNKIRQSVSTSLDMIDNILYWSQSQNGNINHKPQKLNLGQLVNQTVEIYHLSAEKKGILLSAQVEESLFLMADDNMVSFILRNLISNALKFTPREGEIRVIARSLNESQITLRVEDTGVGIKQEHLKKVFNPTQTYTTRGTANEKGTGLGLKLVQQFVKIHQGTFKVESVLGEGSQFIICLPSHASAIATADQPE